MNRDQLSALLGMGQLSRVLPTPDPQGQPFDAGDKAQFIGLARQPFDNNSVGETTPPPTDTTAVYVTVMRRRRR